MKTSIRAAILAVLALAGGLQAADAPDAYRPVLAHNCLKCHGPDERARQADFRLDVPGGAASKGAEIIRRIKSTDLDERMPPPEANKTLTEAEIAALERWVASGAAWTPHWSFVAPRRPAVPGMDDSDWPRNEIDRFVLARLRAAGLQPSVEADRYALVRRLYLDLVGFPPTIEEADAFAMDDSPRAWKRLVDALLDSPHYGERWARRWLDLARYADTNGYEKDRPRSIWPYRDWVIRALNADMPFDRFTIEQIAGDLLPASTEAEATRQRVATGFHRNTMLNEEGGIDPLEFRFHAMTDRVATTGTTWLGLTLGCAQCHTHKFDPITQTEYYRIMAFLDNADEPDLDLPTAGELERARRNREEAARLTAELPEHWPVAEGESRDAAIDAAFESWLSRERRRASRWRPLVPSAMSSNLPHLAVEADACVFVSGDTTKHDTYELVFELGRIEGAIAALRLEALPDDRLPAHGPGMTFYEGRKGDFFLSEFRVTVGGKSVPIASASHSYAKNRFGNNPVSAALATDGDFQTGWSVAGRIGERHVAVFVLAEPIDSSAGELRVRMDFGRHYASSLGRFRLSATTNDRAIALDFSAEIENALVASREGLEPRSLTALCEAFLLSAPELEERTKRIRELLAPPVFTTTLVMKERPPDNPRPTHRRHRGEYLRLAERVEPGTPAALHALPTRDGAAPTRDGARPSRLDFARWLVSRENPLTARVTVNREWAAFFGEGIVRTLDDFGLQGERPSHPDLLDWLAVEFMEHGWSLKRLHRLIVMSATYRQTSKVSPERLAKDASNRFLSRGPRFRLEAETLRDSILRSAGLLSTKLYGPPVRPPQPAGVTEVAYGAPKWEVSRGADRHRRSVYTFIKRTAPFAMFTTFDGTSGESCVARRDKSNSPLQALTLLNDVMFVEAAQALGTVIAAVEGDTHARAERAFRRVLIRKPSAGELDLLEAFAEKQRRRFTSGELDATSIAGAPDAGDVVERAVWTAVSRALFALDETQTKG